MTDVASLQQVVHQAWIHVRQARQYSRMARERATITMQEVQHTYHRARVACLALSMPEANPVTLAITATILASHGLLDDKPAIRPPSAVATGDPSSRQGWRRAGHYDD